MFERRYPHGQHVCALYRTPQERISQAADYLQDGLNAGDRILYVAESTAALEDLRKAIAAGVPDFAARDSRGAVLAFTHDEAHLQGGHFDAERMLQMLNEAIDAALDFGFAGLRTCGDMSWLLRHVPGSDQLLDYESMVTSMFEGRPASGMCQYDESALSHAILDGALTTHPMAVVAGAHRPNPSYRPLTPDA